MIHYHNGDMDWIETPWFNTHQFEYRNGDQLLKYLTRQALWRAYAIRFMTAMDYDILDDELTWLNHWN